LVRLNSALLRLPQHRLGNIDAANPAVARILRQRDAGADADFQDAAADALGRGDRRVAAAFKHRAEDEIVDRRPPRIGLGDGVGVEVGLRKRAHA
jgi:hypothetical protein